MPNKMMRLLIRNTADKSAIAVNLQLSITHKYVEVLQGIDLQGIDLRHQV
jgi:hypothetical protein